MRLRTPRRFGISPLEIALQRWAKVLRYVSPLRLAGSLRHTIRCAKVHTCERYRVESFRHDLGLLVAFDGFPYSSDNDSQFLLA
ncbi:hypothetical protein J6590_031129 [Homalodisca vitripennis]|nr:hypothetical protein J6590_101885 [Homalodisca vitripennis]KAG8337149.1 hypothetical protein J6590_031127 [Homalodisca vitripennis]KAG8337151.1 hypothetical protein J6590_031129 [Homalodisca vitripennis]